MSGVVTGGRRRYWCARLDELTPLKLALSLRLYWGMAHSDAPQASSAGPLSPEQRRLASLMARRLNSSALRQKPPLRPLPTTTTTGHDG